MRLLLAALLLQGSVYAKPPVNATDLLRIRQITEVTVAPDGTFAIYGVRSVHTDTSKSKEDPAYSYRTNLWFVDLTQPGAKPRQITFGDRNDRSIALSPDAKTLAFVRNDTEKKLPQVWTMPVGGPGEASQITRLDYGATEPRWHPKGHGILVSSAIPISKADGKPDFPMERPGRDWFDYDRPKDDAKVDARPDGDLRAVRNWLERNAAKDNPSAITRLQFQAEQGLEKEMRVPQLYFVDLANGNRAKALTQGWQRLSECAYSPDGGQLVCLGPARGNEHPDRNLRSAVWMMSSDGTGARTFLDDQAETFLSVQFFEGRGNLLITALTVDQPTFRQARLAVVDLADSKLRWISKAWTPSVQKAQAGAGGSVLFTSPWHGGVPLMRITDGAIQGVVTGPVGVTAFGEGGGRLVYGLISAANPNELYVREKDGSSRALTALHSEWLAGRELSAPEEKWITRPDGVKVQMWVMNPVGAQAGKKYPWVLEMHGGPTAMWGPGEFSMWHEFQLLCAWGYGVVYSNPRGSGGYGYEFQQANYKNWGQGPAGDVLAALDDTVANNPYVDKERLFLTGGSYAGYLTAWILGHDQRFKAAASQRGVYDLTTFYGEGNAFKLVEYAFGGRPYEPETRRLLDQQSPFTYVDKIRTPLLILHGSEDGRTGVSQSEMLYRALKDLQRPVEYIRYPGTGHELTRSGPPGQRMDHMLRIVEFFERYRN